MYALFLFPQFLQLTSGAISWFGCKVDLSEFRSMLILSQSLALSLELGISYDIRGGFGIGFFGNPQSPSLGIFHFGLDQKIPGDSFHGLGDPTKKPPLQRYDESLT